MPAYTGDKRSCYAYAPGDTKSDWKLPLCDESGELDGAIVGAAKAALSPGGFRGRRVQIPDEDRPAVVRRVNAAARKLDLDPIEAAEFHDEHTPPAIKLPKADSRVNYREGSDEERCYGCRFYQWGGCALVEGGIEADDVCDLYTAPLRTAPAAMYAVRHDGERPSLSVFTPIAVELAEPPEWAPFLPVPGRYRHPVYGDLDFSPEKYERIVANFKRGAYQERIPVNAEHDAKASGALGWITDLRLADDGAIDARVEWTERGESLVRDDRFRYVSAEFYDDWTDPVTGEAIPDVAVGLALTTHPYFKESVLRPLAASEAVLTRVAAGEHRPTEPEPEVRMSEKAPETTTPPEVAPEKTPAEPSATQMSEAMIREFRELKAAHAKTQADLTKLSAENAELKRDTLVKRFTDEVRGRSDENGTPWVGDVAGHVGLLCDLAEKFGVDSGQVRQYVESNRGHAEQLRASDLFREFGTGRAPEGSGQARIDAATDALMAADPKLSRAQAVTRVLSERPELYDEYQRDRR